MGSIKPFKFERVKQKVSNYKKNFKKGLHECAEWIWENKEMVMFFTPAIVATVTTGIKVIGKHNNLNKEKELKELYIYDRSLGHYWKLKRELTNSELVKIDKRKQQGERMADILSELKVLK